MRERFFRAGNRSRAASSVSARTARPRGRVLVAIAAAFALALAPFMPAAGAQAVTYNFVIDSLDGSTTARDATPGDGVCKTASGACTLRAAIEESNALKLPAGAVLITAKPGLTGNIDSPNLANARMTTATVATGEGSGAYLEITSPVTIDLENRVTVAANNDANAAQFHVNSADVVFKNVTQILAGVSSFVMGPNANRVLIDGGSSVTQANYFPERFVTLREGAKNITVQNYRLQGFYYSGTSTGLFYVDAQRNTPIENVVIDNVQITYPTNTTCSSSDGSGCQTDILQFARRGSNVILDGFTFTNSFVSNLTARDAFPFASSTLASSSVNASNIRITDNEFINVRGRGTAWYNAFIILPHGPIAGENAISGNKFVRDTSGQGYAIAWNGNTSTGSAGNLQITNNYFNGYTANSIYLHSTGDISVERNTFGARSASQARPGNAEETRDGTSVMFDNQVNANGRVTTWYPKSDAKVLTAEAPAGSIQVESPLPEDVPACVATLDAVAPTDGPFPAAKVDLDLYWTQDRTAEVYLGRVENVTGSSAKLLLDLPVGPQEFPSTVVGNTDTATIVDADTGMAGGYIRMQTIGSDTRQSSQYSRMVGFSGSCRPELTINQKTGQNDPTLARDLHYTVKSSLPLNPDSVTAAVVDVTAASVPETIDAGRLNPRSVSVTPVAGTADREFEVIARVDDSAKVTAGIAADRVRSTGGLTNRAAAASTDPDITFRNPISVKPGSFTLVTGEPDGKQYGFSLAAGAPAPSKELSFAATPDQAATDNAVELSSPTATIGVGETASNKIRVTAGAGDVQANTPVTVTHTVTSDDTNYDGLVVNTLLVKLFSTDPSVKITKRAFVDVSDTSTPAQIMATGTEALPGTRLMDGQPVCFVYEVANISADDWATVLSDVTVTDTDTRLGEDGVIGTIAKLPVGESTRLSACGSLIPVDTTSGAAR